MWTKLLVIKMMSDILRNGYPHFVFGNLWHIYALPRCFLTCYRLIDHRPLVNVIKSLFKSQKEKLSNF